MKNLTHKKLLLLAFLLLFGVSGYSQQSGIEFKNTQEINCLPRGETKTFRVTVPPELVGQHIQFTTRGDIIVVREHTNADSVTITTCENGFGKGILTACITYHLDSAIIAGNPCFEFGCRSPIGSVSTSIDIYQKFSPSEMYPHDQIFGSTGIVAGGTFVYSVKAILTRNIMCRIGLDTYTWSFPEHMVYVLDPNDGDGSSRTVRVKEDATIGIDTIRVVMGRCNTLTPLIKILDRGSKLPSVTHDSLICTDADIINFWIDSVQPGYTYWWRSSNPYHLRITPQTAGNTHIKVITQGAGIITLFASNGLDTVSAYYKIIPKITDTIRIHGETDCLLIGDVLPFYLYPSPHVEVLWIFPHGWSDDINNNHYSSSIYVEIFDDARPGHIVAKSKICLHVFDSIFVTVMTQHVPERIFSENGVCFSPGDTATFWFNRDPNATSYTWAFPSDCWIPLIGFDNPTSNNYDTVMKVIVGDTNGRISVEATVHCGDEGWTLAFDSVFAMPSIGSVLLPEGCINDGVVDTITLTAVGAIGVEQYQWVFPSTWSVLNAIGSTITLQTDDLGGNREVLVVGTNRHCPNFSDTAKKTIVPDGADVNIAIRYNRLAFPPINPNIQIIATMTPTGIYTFRWYVDTNLNLGAHVSTSATFTSPLINIAQHKYSIVVTNVTTGCATRAWYPKNPFDDDAKYKDSVIVIPPTPATAPLTEIVEIVENTEPTEIVVVTPASAPIPTVPQQTPPPPSVAENPIVEMLETTKPTFRFHPNPANGNIYLQFDGNADWVEILDLRGLMVTRQRVSGSTEATINVSNLRIGTYIVRVFFGEIAVSERLQIIR